MPTRIAILVLASALLAACKPPAPIVTPPAVRRQQPLPPRVVPEPVSLTAAGGDPFVVTNTTAIVVDAGSAEASRTAEQLAALLRPSTGFPIPVSSGAAPAGAIVLRLSPDAGGGSEGYSLAVSRDSVRITASSPAGLFYGVQTLRQLLPPQIESHMTHGHMAWMVPPVAITDQPRYGWRGAMLDVARHFFTVDEVEQYIDLLALYKLNRLHLHLSDDQGWRIEIRSRPKLAELGSVTQVGGGPGGYYTQDQYREIVRYAQDRYVTIVPEIDMPGHINSALIGYPELSCSVRPPAPYTGTDVGWSTLCANKEETYAFVHDVVTELASLTPGRWFHMGGDENPILSKADYTTFVQRTQEIVDSTGKQMVGWEEIAQAPLKPTTIAQAWRKNSAAAAAAVPYGAKVLMSPSQRTYFDMKYDSTTELGLSWAGLVDVRDAYDWDPAATIPGVGEANIVGVEAPIWSETLRNITAVEFLAVPRVPALAEVAWTPQATRNWDSFRQRLAAQAPRWQILGINYYPSKEIPW